MKEVKLLNLMQSEELGIISIVELISTELIQIYKKVASEYEKGEGDQIDYALTYYEKCREVKPSINLFRLLKKLMIRMKRAKFAIELDYCI